jgi:hypothetical protein
MDLNTDINTDWKFIGKQSNLCTSSDQHEGNDRGKADWR